MNRELFVETLNIIKQQQKAECKFIDAISFAFDDYPIYTLSDPLTNQLLRLLKELTNDKYDYIPWWLYEPTDYILYDGDKKYNLKKPEKLYDFIINNK